jgi:hypothetical protein
MPIVRTRQPHFGGLGYGGVGWLGQGAGTAYGPGAVCLDDQEQPISCLDPTCTYGDCGSTAPAAPGNACLGPTINGVETQIACTDPQCTYGDCINVPRPPGSGGNPNYPEGGLPQGTSPNVTTVMQVTPKPAPIVASPSGTPPGYQPGIYPQANWFTQYTMIGGMAIPNWTFLAVGLGAAILISQSQR